MKFNISLLGAFVGVLAFTSCGSDEKPADNNVEIESSAQGVEVQTDEEFILPSTIQIGDLFRNSGLEFVSGVALDPSMAGTYNTTYDKYFALGVYWTDMTYCVLNQKSQEARSYMKVIKSLSTELGAGEVYSDEVLLKRFDDNLDNNDSILMILIEIDEKTDRYVEDNEQQEMAMFAFVSGWTEGMYLGVSTTSLEGHSAMTGRIMEQMVILKNIIKGIKPYQGSSAKVDEAIASLEDLYDFYINIPSIKNVEGNISDVKIPTADMKILGNKIVDLRNLLVK